MFFVLFSFSIPKLSFSKVECYVNFAVYLVKYKYPIFTFLLSYSFKIAFYLFTISIPDLFYNLPFHTNKLFVNSYPIAVEIILSFGLYQRVICDFKLVLFS